MGAQLTAAAAVDPPLLSLAVQLQLLLRQLLDGACVGERHPQRRLNAGQWVTLGSSVQRLRFAHGCRRRWSAAAAGALTTLALRFTLAADAESDCSFAGLSATAAAAAGSAQLVQSTATLGQCCRIMRWLTHATRLAQWRRECCARRQQQLRRRQRRCWSLLRRCWRWRRRRRRLLLLLLLRRRLRRLLLWLLLLRC